jgi:large subunit ribosomal protein L25
MSTVTMNAAIRTKTGKGAARKIRDGGLVPAIVYRAGNEPSLVNIDPKILTVLFEKTQNPNTLVKLEIDSGQEATCLVKEVQRHPVSGEIRHVDFYQVSDEEDIVVKVPVRTVGRAIGTTLGGVLRIIRRELEVSCKPQFIPDAIEVDVTNLDIGKFITVNEITNLKGTVILFDDKGIFNVVTVIKRRGE